MYHTLLAEIDGVVVGYASYLVQFDSWGGQSYLNLDDLFVQEEARGKGVGQHIDAHSRASRLIAGDAGSMGSFAQEHPSPRVLQADRRIAL
jgi:GNAT superfamily N-acetyltransferase